MTKALGDARIITSGAERMRRSRQRHRQGNTIISLQLGRREMADMIALGWLSEAACGDKHALTNAAFGLIERAIRAGVTPITGSEQPKVSFCCDLKSSTIETLIDLGWLKADQRDNFAAIKTAFRRFAGRSLEIARNSLESR
jgi:hypothetical protein